MGRSKITIQQVAAIVEAASSELYHGKWAALSRSSGLNPSQIYYWRKKLGFPPKRGTPPRSKGVQNGTVYERDLFDAAPPARGVD